MKFKDAFLWQPNWRQQSLMMVIGALFVSFIGYLHILTGLAYEFHAFFIVPILTVSWFLGRPYGFMLAILAAAEWLFADHMLGGDAEFKSTLLFNSVVRLGIFIGGAWLIGEIRLILLRESRLAREDALTQLPNRREFYERGRQAFAQGQRQGSSFAAVFIDLDGFKMVNDCHGHDIGDQLLESVAATMRAHVRSSDVMGRLGGDEFALILPNMRADAVQAYVEKLRRNLLDVMEAEGWPVTFSIGVASYRTTPQDFDALIKKADELMYEVKQSSRNGILLREY
jgi:diguanylate cyclase (GGDEF)-like protein